ncbi:hypothetical protein [Pseudomonas silensiensis]|uniref:hypothetical protein n=1 Tax=Pseudomonas silensiensis TaxID=2991049 RepID=UPI003D1C5BC3
MIKLLLGQCAIPALVDSVYLHAGAFMELKGSWKGLGALGLAITIVIGQSFLGYVTENGQLPPWMPEKLGGLASWLASEISIPLWSLVLILVCIGFAGTLFVKYQPRATADEEDRLAATAALLAGSHQRNIALEAHNVLLQQQLHERRQAVEAVEVEVSANGLKVLAIIARCTDREVRATLSTIAAALPAGHVEAHAAIDVLIERRLLEKVTGTRGAYFRFTPKGRAYYLKNKE